MYSIAISVASCLRANTRVDVAWLIDSQNIEVADRTEAIAITPGGGRMGDLVSGALDAQLVDVASRHSATGRFVRLRISPVDALIAGIASGGEFGCVIAPASTLPAELWSLLVAREPVCLVANLEDDSVTDFVLYTESSIDQADSVAQALFERGKSDSEIVNNKIISVFWPVPKIVIVGTGPNAQALRESAALLGWQTVITSDAGSAQGVIAGVSALDSIVIMIHDLDIAGAALSAALSSKAGYIGALGSKRMQETRAEWLAYRGITDLTRIHGPAGINIGAKTPAEIAISILAQALSVVKLG